MNAGPDTAVADVDESGTLTTIIAALRRKLAASLDRLEKDIGMIAARPLDIGHVSLGAALLYLDFRFAAEAWREQRPTLADWHAEFAARRLYRGARDRAIHPQGDRQRGSQEPYRAFAARCPIPNRLGEGHG